MRLTLLPLLLLVPLLNTGCTALMWGEALDSRATDPQVSAVIERRGQERLVVTYRGGADFDVLLPVDEDGRLAAPLVYDGLERTPEAILNDISANQQAALREFRFANERACSYTRTIAFIPHESYRVSIDEPELGAVLVALDANNRPLPLVKYPSGRMALADDARIVLIPRQQPRQTGEQAVHIAAAVVFTPLTLAADVVFVPTVVVLAMGGAFTD